MPIIEIDNDSSAVIPGLTLGQRYVFRVGAEDGTGGVAFSDWSTPLEVANPGVSWSDPPTSAGDPGNPGDVAYDDNYFYVYTQSGWRRSALGTWNPTITITTQPQNLAIGEGDSGNFTVAATVDDGSTPSYQWQSSDDSGATWDTLTGSNSTTYSVSGVAASDNGTQYRAVVSSQGAANVTSSVATLTVGETFDLLVENGDRLMTEGGVSIDHDGTTTGPEPSGEWMLIAAVNGGSGDTLTPVATNQDGTVIVAGVEQVTNAEDKFAVYELQNGSLNEVYRLPSSIIEGDRAGDEVGVSDDGTVVISRSTLAFDDVMTGYLYVVRNSEGVWGAGRSTVGFYSGGVAISGDGSYAILGSYAGYLNVSRRLISGTSVGAADSFGIAELYFTAGNTNYVIRRNIGTSLATNSDGNIVAAAYQFPGWGVSGVSGGNDPGGSGLLGASPSITVYEGSWASGGGTPYVAQAGAVVVMEWTGAAWAQRGDEIIGSDPLIPYGDSVSLSANGNRLAVGTWRAAGGGAERGEVQVYDWSGSTWSQVGSTLTGDSNYDHFGRSVSISADGSTLVVGSPGDDLADGNAGSVTAYTWTGSDWQQAGQPVAPPTSGTTNWLTGQSVSVSGDGFRFVASAPGANGGNGKLSVYERQNNQITITQQPQDVTYSGAPVVFSANATVSDNSSPSYLWQSSSDNGSTWANLSGETSSSLTVSNITPSDDGNQYRAVISAARAPSATTDNATLTVNENVLFSQQPQNTTVVAGNDATFSATLTPADNWYVYDMKWERADSGSPNSWNVVETEDIASYTISSSSAVALNYTWPSASSFDDGDLFRATGAAFENELIQTSPTPVGLAIPQQGEVAWLFGLILNTSAYWSAATNGAFVVTCQSRFNAYAHVWVEVYINGTLRGDFQGNGPVSSSAFQVSSGDQIRVAVASDGSWYPRISMQFTPTAGLQTQSVTSATATLNVT